MECSAVVVLRGVVDVQRAALALVADLPGTRRGRSLALSVTVCTASPPVNWTPWANSMIEASTDDTRPLAHGDPVTTLAGLTVPPTVWTSLERGAAGALGHGVSSPSNASEMLTGVRIAHGSRLQRVGTGDTGQ